MNPPTLYYCPGHMSFAPHVVLYEIGKPFEAVHVAIKEGATQSAEFRRLNPKGKIPVLLADGHVITESAAIMYYLALRHPDSGLLPDDPLGVARAVEWTNWLSAVLASSVSQTLHPGRFSPDVATHPAVKDKGIANLLDAFTHIDGRLAEQEWALASGYSVVDPMLLIFFRWGHVLGLDMDRFPAWSAHVHRAGQRPAVQATLRAEGITIPLIVFSKGCNA
ncbi:glutathione S-transferase family protein [Massilia rhizosphaerae]|uniref:glutathione S-transferase family protein n=1 Tax=Massilia rhizosphaerae TaxID=2784389 RepID=UPI0018DE2ED6|nr:glutathione S-transferase N-terminal domain-containing protein [Massilia rhizosphaerae]